MQASAASFKVATGTRLPLRAFLGARGLRLAFSDLLIASATAFAENGQPG
ncbi:MAG: hypothetical protein ACJ8OJ_00795 [Povalibacter sp.]